MSVTRFGIIGYGETGKAYADAIDASADAMVVATCGPGDEDGRYLHFEAVDGLLARDDIDAVVYAGAPAQAPEALVMAVDRRLPVLCAGPPAASVEEAGPVSAVAFGETLYFANPLACHGSILRAMSIVKQGTLGAVVSIRAVYGGVDDHDSEEGPWRADRRQSGGGVLMSAGYHLISLLGELCGRVEQVSGLLGGADGMERNALGVFRHTSGALSQIHVSSTQWRQMFRVEIGLEKGYLWLDGLAPEEGGYAPEMLISARVRLDDQGCPRANPKEEVRSFEEDTSLNRVLSGFLRSVSGGSVPPPARLDSALDTLSAIQRLYAADPAWARD